MTLPTPVPDDARTLLALTLSIGRSLDPQVTSREFLEALVHLYGLNGASLWWRDRPAHPLTLLHASPAFLARDDELPDTHPLWTLTRPGPLRLDNSDPVLCKALADTLDSPSGHCLCYPLGAQGLLTLHAADPATLDRFTQPEMTPLLQKVAVALEGSLAYQQLQALTQGPESHMAERLYFLAHHDSLTGLPNRHSLLGRLEQTLKSSRRHQRQGALLFLDLDRFKLINDTLGHDIGDHLLVEVAQRLRRSVRDSDVIGRLGGDEFVVVLTELDGLPTARRIAEKIIEAIAQPCALGTHLLHTTTSVGIACFPEDGDEAETLMKHADIAMYAAKAAGRGVATSFSRQMLARMSQRLQIEVGLRDAVRNGELSLHYQPTIAFHDGRIVGLEALLRWEHPVLGAVPPADFIPVAEETGLIIPIGQWVLETSSRQIHAWRQAGVPCVPVAINLSARQLHDDRLIDFASQMLTRYRLAASDVSLDISESLAMNPPGQSIERLRAFEEVGFSLSVDDFGTGYSSLAHLKLLPIDRLKLDRSFVQDIERDPNDADICAATIALAHSLGLQVVAEGVETEAQRDFLKAHGCDFAQGYLYCAPLPAEAMTDILRREAPAQ